MIDPLIEWHVPIDLRPLGTNSADLIPKSRQLLINTDPQRYRLYVLMTPDQFRIVESLAQYPIDRAESLKRHTQLFGYFIVVMG